MIEFFVPGIPGTAGSKRAFVRGGRAIVTDDSGAKGRYWRQDVLSAAREAYQGLPLAGPLRLTVTFVRPRPKSHYRKDGTLKAGSPEWCTTKPDTTKMLRALEDALTGCLWRDDAQIVLQHVAKRYVDGLGCPVPGAAIEVSEAPAP